MNERSTVHQNHVPSRLMRESLVDRGVIARTQSQAPLTRILPHLNVIQIGGRIMDRGAALLPLLEEVVANQKEHTQVVAVGAGARTRHLFAVGIDLGLPTGALATLSAKDAAQNAYMVSCLLAKHGFVYLEAPFIVQLLPAILAASRGAVFNGVPPYDLWEHPPQVGRIPPHRADSGAYLLAEVFGARKMIFLKDVDGLYSHDPAGPGGGAEFIPKITVADLQARNLPTLPIDRIVLDLMGNAKLCKEVQIVNGLEPGALTRALAGEPVGTVISTG
jgi:molybdenum storage protein